ncbi:MAG: PIN domain-containing protein [Treponema sp.]|nr:PIN domain-containing protein [Treponema sp.]
MKDKKNNAVITEEGKVFFDSNILIYFVDERDERKQSIAKEIIADAVQNQNGMISTQSLQEFYNVVTKKMNCPKEKAKELVTMFSELFPVTQITIPLILSAIDISIKNEFSFWDSLILSTANDTGCILIYSEDLNSGQIISGTKVLNPFLT